MRDHKIAKNECCLRDVLFVRLSAWNNSAFTGRILTRCESNSNHIVLAAGHFIGKGKGTSNRPEGARGVEVYLYSFLISALERGGWSASRPGRFTPRKDPVPIVWRLGGLKGRSGRVRKISPQPGFDPRTVQAVAIHYTN
jgi:hypothetical protein